MFSPFVAAFADEGESVESPLSGNKPYAVAGDDHEDKRRLPLRVLVQELPENVGLMTLMRVRDEEDYGDVAGGSDTARVDDKLTLLVRALLYICSRCHF